MKKKKLAALITAAFCLQACTAGNTGTVLTDVATDVAMAMLCGGQSSPYCEMISEQTSEEVSSGTAYDSAYSIQKTVTGKYVLRSRALKAPIVLAKPLSLRKLQSFRTQKATFDIYAAPAVDCPQRYMAVVGNGRQISTNSFGCNTSLNFLNVPQSDTVFATEPPSADGQTPWAYPLTSSGIRGPGAVTVFREHPEYAFYRDRERGIATPLSPGLQPTYVQPPAPAPAPARKPAVTPVGSPPAAPAPLPQRRRLPPPEKVTLPGEVEEKDAVYERPSVDL